jgi:hypothetical protein
VFSSVNIECSPIAEHVGEVTGTKISAEVASSISLSESHANLRASWEWYLAFLAALLCT